MIFFQKNSSGHESVLAKTRESDDAERSFDCMIFFFIKFDKIKPFAREGCRKLRIELLKCAICARGVAQMLGAGVRRQSRVKHGTEPPSGEALENSTDFARVQPILRTHRALQQLFREDEAYSAYARGVLMTTGILHLEDSLWKYDFL